MYSECIVLVPHGNVKSFHLLKLPCIIFYGTPLACHPLVKPIWPLHDCDLFLFCWIANNCTTNNWLRGRQEVLLFSYWQRSQTVLTFHSKVKVTLCYVCKSCLSAFAHALLHHAMVLCSAQYEIKLRKTTYLLSLL